MVITPCNYNTTNLRTHIYNTVDKGYDESVYIHSSATI